MPDDANNDVYEAALDPADDTPDLNDAQAALQQDEQAEAAAAAAGDYATANDDAQQAYGASQDVADAGGTDTTDAAWQAAQDASWANLDQQTADQDALTAASYDAIDSETPNDAADAAMYAGDAQNEEATADDSAAAAVDDTPVDDSAAVDDTATADDDSSAQ